MARRQSIFGRFIQSVRSVFRAEPERPSPPRQPERPATLEPEARSRRQPERRSADDYFASDADTFGSEPSSRDYHIILRGYGPVWFRPIMGDERTTRDYVINMQGFLRHGSPSKYADHLRELRRMTVSGVLVDGTVIDDVAFETILSEIEESGNEEDMLTGGGWKS